MAMALHLGVDAQTRCFQPPHGHPLRMDADWSILRSSVTPPLLTIVWDFWDSKWIFERPTVILGFLVLFLIFRSITFFVQFWPIFAQTGLMRPHGGPQGHF